MERLELGDEIETELANSEVGYERPGRILRAGLDTPEALEYGRELVASGRWRKVVRQSKEGGAT